MKALLAAALLVAAQASSALVPVIIVDKTVHRIPSAPSPATIAKPAPAKPKGK